MSVKLQEFVPTGLGDTVFKERYAHNNESYSSAVERLITAVGVNESEQVKEDFHSALINGLFMPGGRIWYGAGRPVQQLANCYVVPAEDTREGWGATLSDTLITSGMGGGVGINCSPVRPLNYPIRGVGGKATGAVSLMRMVSTMGRELVGGGSRRIALMLCLDIDHPDVADFIKAKLDRNELNNANVSVILPKGMDVKQFATLAAQDKELPLLFNGELDVFGNTVNARWLWNTIVKNAWSSGEPGVLNGSLANEMNSMGYLYDLISTNPCGEQWLPAYGSCNLGALVLPRFVSSDGHTDYKLLASTIASSVRFLDCVLDASHYPLSAQREVSQQERRIGLGVMGLHSYLLERGMAYSSPEAVTEVDQLFSFIKNTAYKASVELSKEKGAFPLYDARYLTGRFVRSLDRSVHESVARHGLRNCCILTVAPTGTTSMVHGVTGGIEPMFAPVYFRRRYVDTGTAGKPKLVKTLVVPTDYIKHPDIAEGAYDLSPEQHFKMQYIVQQHIDSSVSKTINLPKAYPVGDLSALWLKYLPYLKGATFYREGSRGEEPLEYVNRNDIPKILSEWNGEIEYGGLDAQDCAAGICSI